MIPTPEQIADQLGALRAQIRDLQSEQKKLEGYLKSAHITEANGRLFRVAIAYDAERKTVGWKTIAEKLEPSRQLITANTTVSVYDRVTVSAHKKGA